MFPKRLKRVRFFTPDPTTPGQILESEENSSGIITIRGRYDVRDMSQYYEPTGLFLPDDWSQAAGGEVQPPPAGPAPKA